MSGAHRAAIPRTGRPTGPAQGVGGAVGLLVVAGLSAGAALGGARLAVDGWPALVGQGTGDPAAALLCLVWAVVALLAGWLALGVLVCVVAATPGALGRVGARAAARTTPVALRRLASAALGGALLAGGLAPVSAFAAGGPGQGTAASVAAGYVAAPRVGADALPDLVTWSSRVAGSGLSPDLLPATSAPGAAPTPPTTGPPTTSPPTTAPSPTGSPTVRPPTSLGALAPAAPRSVRSDRDQVVVADGDCLWDIAAARMPAGEDAAGIARATADWYATNRAVVGPDPDHIEPGQVLRAPDQAGGR